MSRKAIVGHHLWSRAGGGEVVNAYVVKTLEDAGFDVSIVSTFSFDKEKLREWFGVEVKSSRIYTLLPFMIPAFGIYQRLCFFIPLKKAIKRERPDLVFIDIDLYRPILKLKEEYKFKLIEYIHFPFDAIRIDKGDVPEEYRQAFEKYITEAKIYYAKYERGFWRLYWKLWLKLYSKFVRGDPFRTADLVLTNSKYIARLTKMLWPDGDPKVLHPPVRVRDFEGANRRGFDERDNAVVMIGRIAPEKRIDTVIEAIAISETKPKLRVVGGLIPSMMWYKAKLEKLAKERGVELEILTNVPRDKLIEVACSSKVFVHATVGEHFGIAVVEGMASGCPAIVHRSGGPWEDIANYGEFAEGFDSIEELASKIDKFVSDEKLWTIYHEKSISRSLEFSEERFSKKLLEYVEEVLSS